MNSLILKTKDYLNKFLEVGVLLLAISIIAEIKKKSPSSGVIIKNFNPLYIAKIYIDNGASFLSVLTSSYVSITSPVLISE